jgi:hypothetical protein
LIHTIGYHDPVIAKAFKSSNGLERLNAYRKILEERDRFAMELGFNGHFEQVIKDVGQPVGVTVPNGVPSVNGTTETAYLAPASLTKAAEGTQLLITSAPLRRSPPRPKGK